MDEDRPEQTSPEADLGRAKRPPPTIDLEPSEVSGETQGTSQETSKGTSKATNPDAGPAAKPARSFSWPSAISAMLTAAVTSAVTASLVVAVAWVIGSPGETAPTTTSPQANVSAIDALASRIDEIEARSSKPSSAAPDPAQASRFEQLDKSVAALRSEVAVARRQSEKLAADLDAVKSAPRGASAMPDLAAINQRLDQIERAVRAASAEATQADSKPADDAALRRLVAASMLDASVRQGEPFVAALAAAKSLAPDPQALQALDDFAAKGVPNAASLGRELLTLVPKLTPPAPENATTGNGIVDRMKAGAAKLVRIERTDVVGNDRSAIVARVTAAALHNDYADARRELMTLEPGDRAAAQAWLDKANQRDAALAAARHFATEAMAALAKPAQ